MKIRVNPIIIHALFDVKYDSNLESFIANYLDYTVSKSSVINYKKNGDKTEIWFEYFEESVDRIRNKTKGITSTFEILQHDDRIDSVPQFELIESTDPSDSFEIKSLDEPKSSTDWFASSEEIWSSFDSLVRRNGNLFKKSFLPYVSTNWFDKKTQEIVEGKRIPYYIAGDRANAKKQIVLIGGLHGNEIFNPFILLDFYQQLVQFSLDESLREHIQSNELESVLRDSQLIFIPIANPGGRDYACYHKLRGFRKNLNLNPDSNNSTNGIVNHIEIGVDLNRNFPSFFGQNPECILPESTEYQGLFPGSENETRNLQSIIYEGNGTLRPTLVFDLHSSGREIIAPTCHIDNPYSRFTKLPGHLFEGQEIIDLGNTQRHFSNSVDLYNTRRGHPSSQFMTSTSSTVGTTKDYFYQYHSVKSFTVETLPNYRGFGLQIINHAENGLTYFQEIIFGIIKTIINH